MRSLLALAVLCAPMFSCSPAHAEDDITLCGINGARLQQAMYEHSTHNRLFQDRAGDLVLMFTQGQVSVGYSSGDRALDIYALSVGMDMLKLYPLPAKCTAVVPVSYVEQLNV